MFFQCLWLTLVSQVSLASTAEQARDAARAYRAAHELEIISEFSDLLSIPNVAADNTNIRRNADHIVAMMKRRGIDARLLDVGSGPPAVYGEIGNPRAAHTVLIYVHYDGQPVSDGWASDPWTPVIRDGRVEDGSQIVAAGKLKPPINPDWRLYARSAGDDKVPIIGLLYALDALEAAGIPLSLRIKFFFEGEEEAGSPNLQAMLSRHADLLTADLWLFCDGPIHQTGKNQVVFGVRGMAGFDLTVYGPRRQLHSGHYGNWAPNPIMQLAYLLTSMRDADGRIAIDGFDDHVARPTQAELDAIAAAPAVDQALKTDLGLGHTEGSGERLERLILNPALNLRGIQAGQVGDEARNAIVDEATASIGLRLVPDLTPSLAAELVERHIRGQGYFVVREVPDLETRLQYEKIARVVWGEHGYPAVRFDLDDPRAAALVSVIDPVVDGGVIRMPTMGGSLPLHVVRTTLNVPIVLLPVANHDNNQHGPNENIRLGNLWTAIEIYAAVFAAYGNELQR